MATVVNSGKPAGIEQVYWGDKVAVIAALVGTAVIWILALINILLMVWLEKPG